MEREYDIRYELGPRNWLDSVAGEAVVLGYLTHDPELEMMGTALAKRLGEVHYDDDNFFKVEAQASELKEKVRVKKETQKMILFIDEICEYDGRKKSLYKWEYNLTFSDGRYRVTMLMPEYFGYPPKTQHFEQVEEVVQTSYQNPCFEELKEVKGSKTINDQKMDTTDHYTADGRLMCHMVDFNHEADGIKRGLVIICYMDEYSQAIDTWVKIKAISSRR